MLARICDGCGNRLTNDTATQLSKRTIKVSEDNKQVSSDHTFGEYCDSCLINGRALRDLMGEKWSLQSELNLLTSN